MTLVNNFSQVRKIIPTSIIGMVIWCLLVLNMSCSRYTASFTSNNSYRSPSSAVNLVHDKSDSVETTPELIASTKENVLLIDHSRLNSNENRNELNKIKRQINASKETKEVITVTGKEPVNGNRKKNGFAAAGFIFSAISLVLLLSQSPLFLLTLPLALLFSILGLKSKEKTLSITGLIIAAGITAFVIAYFIFFIISLQNTPK